MSSLYSAQLVMAAREQLNHQLDQKNGHQPTAVSPATHHNPYHYHETVHEKCKHHNQPQGKVQHSKEGERYIKEEERQTASKERSAESIGSARRIIGEHEEIKQEMKAWARILQAWTKGEHKINDKQLHQHHTKLYKWMLFSQDLFTTYEGTLRTQTSIHALEQEEQHSHRLIHDPHGVATSLHRPSQGGVKLPQIFNRERVESLEARVAELEHQLEAEHAANLEITKKFKDLSVIVAESEEKHKRQQEKLHHKQKGLMLLLGDLQDFCEHLQGDLDKPQKLKNEYPKIVEEKLVRIREERSSLEKSRR